MQRQIYSDLKHLFKITYRVVKPKLKLLSEIQVNVVKLQYYRIPMGRVEGHIKKNKGNRYTATGNQEILGQVLV